MCIGKFIVANEQSGNEHDVTSAYSINDQVQNEADKLIDGQKEFSSLIYLAKRINSETKNEYVDKFIGGISEPRDHTNNRLYEEHKIAAMSKDELIQALKNCVITTSNSTFELSTSSDHFQTWISDTNFELADKNSLWWWIVAQIWKVITNDNNGVVIDENQNISLYFDLEDDKSRDFMIALSEAPLPEIFTLKIENFYESDEDLEKFISTSLRYVSNLVFISESFWVDIHDYLTFILKISWLSNLYLKGFMIDSDDWKRIFSSTNVQWVTFESWNLAIEDDFSIRIKSNSDKTYKSILSKIVLIDNEMEMETMHILLKSIKRSPLKDSFKSIELVNWEELSKSSVKNAWERLSLNIIVQ